MAVTGFWPIYKSLKATLAYADNPDKTTPKEYMDDDLYATNNISDIEKISPAFYETLKKQEVETLLIVRIDVASQTDGYLLCAEPRNRRIWQEAECAMLYFLAKMVAARIRIDGETLE